MPLWAADFPLLLPYLLELLLDSTTWLEVLANANYAANYQVYSIVKS